MTVLIVYKLEETSNYNNHNSDSVTKRIFGIHYKTRKLLLSTF